MNTPQTQSLFSLTAIQLGGAFCLPVIMVGQLTAQSYGLATALIALMLGNTFLYLSSYIIGSLTMKYRCSTLDLARILLGQKGALIGSIALLIPMVGWFAIQLDFIGHCINELIPSLPIAIGSLLAGIGLMLSIRSGIKGVGLLSSISLPLLGVATTFALYKICTEGLLQLPAKPPALFPATITIIAVAIAAVVDIPTYYRFAPSAKTAHLSLALVFLIGLPLIELIGVLMGAFLPGKTLLDVFTTSGAGYVATLVTLALGFKGFTTNSTNLYSAAVSLHALVPAISPTRSTLITGTVGLALSCLPLLENLETALSALAVATSSLGALFLITYRSPAPQSPLPIVAWFVGVGVGICSLLSLITLTGEPICDAFLATALIASPLLFVSPCFVEKLL
ncbi:TPA: hypothetical protein DDZ86_04935 [Candidatus Dependentiae bacterium]|nr:MAG: hypothetical protein A2Y17_09740 [Clostridiales bacterium GWF2_38_85]HBL98956.1 hypothetical protein [Candidatus Dependentiae bacterium]